MKAKIRNRGILGGILLPGLLTTQITFGQTNLQFTSVNTTDEGAIQLHWASQPGHFYEIDEADALIDTNTGSTTWNRLYNDYPSQGTNTFIGDFGNYLVVPNILHPKDMPMRFYRIMDEGVDTISNEPTVLIVSPTNGFVASGSLTVTIAASTNQGNIYPKLYVDGQAMWPSEDGSNYVLNTCEWGNGPHILFATVDSSTAIDGPMDSSGFTGHGVSPFVPVTFSNLISRISFSQYFFQPSLGQTQQVTASFAANCDWTLTIRDAYSNAVRTVTGSGSSLLFNWDGTGDGETNIPNGVYYYYIDAQTNGESDEMAVGSSPSPSFADSDLSELWAIPANSEDVAPLALYPPGFDTNGFTIFAASPSEIESLRSSSSSVAMDSGSGVSPDDTSIPAAQSGPPTPQRPPTDPVIGIAGTFGIVYDTYSGNGTNGIIVRPLPDGSGLPGQYIRMQTFPASTSLGYAPLPSYNAEANNFINEMQLFGWRCHLHKVDDQFSINDLRGSGTPFNQVELGVMMFHGTYGTTMDYAAGLCQQMYYPVTAGASGQYLRLSEMNLGGSDPTNGLKWFAILACNSLQHNNWANMQSHGIKPYNSNLHLLLGVDSTNSTSSVLLQYWAQYMNFG
ncbi:MAG: hypothetical protein ACREFE_15445, partial [Limisphaerales bacterium]